MHEIPVTTAWTRHVFTYIATGRNLNFLFKDTGVYYIYRPKLEIGNTASDWTAHPSDDFVLNEFKLDLSPAGAAFTDGTNIPVTVNKNGMVAQSIETGNLTINRDSEHRHGDWVWKQRGNGNYGLQWKGVTE